MLRHHTTPRHLSCLSSAHAFRLPHTLHARKLTSSPCREFGIRIHPIGIVYHAVRLFVLLLLQVAHNARRREMVRGLLFRFFLSSTTPRRVNVLDRRSTRAILPSHKDGLEHRHIVFALCLTL